MPSHRPTTGALRSTSKHAVHTAPEGKLRLTLVLMRNILLHCFLSLMLGRRRPPWPEAGLGVPSASCPASGGGEVGVDGDGGQGELGEGGSGESGEDGGVSRVPWDERRLGVGVRSTSTSSISTACILGRERKHRALWLRCPALLLP